jgi:hypothetical protein
LVSFIISCPSGTNRASGGETIVNLEEEGIPQNTPFYLSENTVFGTYLCSSEQSFVFNPNSNLIATAERWGSVNNGGVEWYGTKAFNAARFVEAQTKVSPSLQETTAIIHEVLQAVSHPPDELGVFANDPEYTGTVTWPATAAVAIVTAALTYIVQQMINNNYTASFSILGRTAKFKCRKRNRLVTVNSVPVQVTKDWNVAVAAAAAKYPKAGLVNGGITDRS